MPARAKRPKEAAPRRRRAPQGPRVVVVGLGRLGGALARGLRKAGWPVAVLPRSDESVRRAIDLKLTLADHDSLKQAALCVLAVPDAVVGRMAAALRDDLSPRAALVHCAGALDLSAFGTDPEMIRRPRGSLHPLCAVSDPTDELAGHAAALAASQKDLLAVLWKMALALRMRPIEVPEARRAAYHAGAVMAAGGVVALASAAVAAFAEAGVLEDQALAALLPLMRSAVRGVETRGLTRGLTGPVARGDLSVVEAHLSALPAELANIYRALSLRALTLVRDQLPVETRNALERLLRS